MVNAAYSMGLDPKSGWDEPYPPKQAPLMETPELLARLLPGFLAICDKSRLTEAYFPYVAALAAIKLVSAGDSLKLLESVDGKTLAYWYLVAGSKTMPGR